MRRSAQADSKALAAVVSAVALVVGLVFVTSQAEPVQLPKAVVTSVGSAVLAVLLFFRLRRNGDVGMPRSVVIALAAFMAGCAVAVLAGGATVSREVLGYYGRWNGAGLYVALTLLLAAVASSRERVPRILATMAITSTMVAAYATLQRLGLDPVPWINPYGEKVASTVGNPNFAASYIALGLPALMWAFVAARRLLVRVGAVLAMVLSLVSLIWTGSLQGPVVAVTGASVFAYVMAAKFESQRLVLRGGLLGIGGIGGFAAIAGLAGSGPLASFNWSTIRIRFEYWRAAIEMVGDSPIWGWGFIGYASRFRQYRSLEAFEHGSLTFGNDAAHNVFLDMFVSGGLILGLAYLAVIATVTRSFLGAVRQAHPTDLAILGAIGGVWFAYLSQALISVDVPPLAVTGWIAGGLAVAYGTGDDQVSLRLPRQVSARTIPVWGAALAVAFVLGVGSFLLLRQASADRHHAIATQFTSVDPNVALEAALKAAATAPWEPRYVREVGDALYVGGQPEQALIQYESAAEVDPDWLDTAVVSARLSVELGDLERASHWYEQAIEIEPIASELRLEAAEVAIASDQPDAAVTHLEAALEVDPDQAGWWRLLAEARRAAGDANGAEDAERRADELS